MKAKNKKKMLLSYRALFYEMEAGNISLGAFERLINRIKIIEIINNATELEREREIKQ